MTIGDSLLLHDSGNLLSFRIELEDVTRAGLIMLYGIVTEGEEYVRDATGALFDVIDAVGKPIGILVTPEELQRGTNGPKLDRSELN